MALNSNADTGSMEGQGHVDKAPCLFVARAFCCRSCVGESGNSQRLQHSTRKRTGLGWPPLVPAPWEFPTANGGLGKTNATWCYVVIFTNLAIVNGGPTERSYPLWQKIVTISMEMFRPRGIRYTVLIYNYFWCFGDPRFAGREHLRNTFQGKTWFPEVSCRFFYRHRKAIGIYIHRWESMGYQWKSILRVYLVGPPTISWFVHPMNHSSDILHKPQH